MTSLNPTVRNPRVIIIGADFRGLSAASSYAAFQRGTRLITGLSGSRREPCQCRFRWIRLSPIKPATPGDVYRGGRVSA
jgi:hypothetical protein